MTRPGPAYAVLNVIRVFNVTALVAVMSACVAMLVRTSTDSSFFIFAAISHVFTLSTSAVLMVSELSLFKTYFHRHWPLLSAEHGFVTLALLMLAIGINQLAGLNSKSNTQANLGLPIWRLVISSGILNICLGFVNFVASYLFRNKSQHITARHMRSRGAPPLDKSFSMSDVKSNSTPSTIRGDVEAQREIDPVERSVRKHFLSITTNDKAHHRSFHPSYYPASPDSVHDTPQPRAPRRPVSSMYSRATNATKKMTMPMHRWGKSRSSVVPPIPLRITVPTSRMAGVQAVRSPEPVYHNGGDVRYF